MMAALFDAMNTNTAATGNWKKGPPKFDPFPRPGSGDKPALGKKKPSVRDLHSKFTRMMGGG